MTTEQFSTNELGELTITLRDDLVFSLQEYGDELCYVIEDATNSKFFRIGIPEYTFLSLLDGKTTIHQALYQTSAVLGQDAFTEHDAATICKWLVDSDLAETAASVESDRLIERSDVNRQRKKMQWMNPLLLKLPVLNPEPMLRRFAPWMTWMVSFPVFLIWLLAMAAALHQILTNWSGLAEATTQVFAPSNWIWLGVTWLILKLVHELFHALMCKRFGGEVREAGVVLILLAPICYVDVTSSWRFTSKWKRISVAAAGMYVETFIGALAALVWCNSDPGIVQQQAFNVMLLSTVTTLLFNANPLMRFDGYYILADLLEIPNLYATGQQFLSYLGHKYVFGMNASKPEWTTRNGLIVRFYAIAALCWRVFICVGLVLAASTMFFGAGIALAVLGAALWVGLPLYRTGKLLILGNDHGRPNLVRFGTVSAVGIVALAALWLVVPWPFGVKAPAIVDYAPAEIVRAETPGFVRQIMVKPGQHVAAGDVLAVLENKDIESDHQRLVRSVKRSDVQCRVFRKQGEIAAMQAEEKLREAHRCQVDERADQLDKLVVRAVRDGQVIGRDLNALVGTYVTAGKKLFSIGDELSKELVVSVAQEDVELFRSQLGQSVHAYFPGGKQAKFSSKMGSIDPRASTALTHAALAATSGGRLPVRENPDGFSESDELKERWRLIEPRLTGKIELPAELCEQLRAGQLGTIRLQVARGAFGRCLYRACEDWVGQRMNQLTYH